MTLRLNGVDKLEDWPVQDYALMWISKYQYSKKGDGGNRKSISTSYDQLEYMESEQYGDMVIKERPLKSMLGNWIL